MANAHPHTTRISISIFPSWHGVESDGAAGATSGSAIRCTGWNLALASTINWRRHVNNRPVLISCRSAIRFATAPVAQTPPRQSEACPPASTAAAVHGAPEPRSAREDRSQEAAYEPHTTPRPSSLLAIPFAQPSLVVAPAPGKGAVQLTHTLLGNCHGVLTVLGLACPDLVMVDRIRAIRMLRSQSVLLMRVAPVAVAIPPVRATFSLRRPDAHCYVCGTIGPHAFSVKVGLCRFAVPSFWSNRAERARKIAEQMDEWDAVALASIGGGLTIPDQQRSPMASAYVAGAVAPSAALAILAACSLWADPVRSRPGWSGMRRWVRRAEPITRTGSSRRSHPMLPEATLASEYRRYGRYQER